MKLQHIFLILISLMLLGCNKKYKFEHQDLERKYILHIPKDLPDNAPLMVVMHGYSNKAGFIKFYSRMNKVANDNKFAVVYPQGLPDDSEKGVTHWNAELKISSIDDISFITSLVKELQVEHNLNPDRTFAFGLSNGGFMAYTLALKSPGTFAAVASIIGTISGKTWEERELLTDAPIPVLQVSGVLDETVPVDGSMSAEFGWGGAPPVAEVMTYFAERNNCTTSEVSEPSEHVKAFKYENGTNGSKVWYYLVDNLEHTWPNERKHGLKTNELIWEFFSQY